MESGTLTEVEQVILLSAFDDELEKIAFYKQEPYVQGTPARGEGFSARQAYSDSPPGRRGWREAPKEAPRRSGPLFGRAPVKKKVPTSAPVGPGAAELIRSNIRAGAGKVAPKKGHIFGRAVRAVL